MKSVISNKGEFEMSCKDCRCSKKCSPVEQKGLDPDLQRMVVLGHNFVVKNDLTVYEGDFGRRRYHFAFQAYSTPSCPPGYLMIDIGLAVHNPKDKFSASVGIGLVGFMLSEEPMSYGTIVRQKVWKSLNSDQKSRFVQNFIENLCMLEELQVSRRAAMGGR